ncbi:MAG TPA: hypothetical protein VJ020_08830 [Anaerolineales bacterium]|nr:hypothetical protein [Anaerolineales bacterium]
MLNYPLNFSFKIVAFNPQVKVTDAGGNVVLYVKQKALALREDIKIFADEGQTRQLYQLKTNKIIDFSATYNITNAATGAALGALKRQGMRSIFKATYNILDGAGGEAGLIHEENAWVKVADALLGEVPILGIFSGYLFNPAYLVDFKGKTALYLKKQPAFLEGKFTVEKRGDFSDADEGLLISSVVMTLMLERMRG